MIEGLLIAALISALIIPAILGNLVLFHTLVKPMTEPCDESNRIAHLRLVWFAMTREEEFVSLYPWLKKDEKDNLKTE